MLRMCMKAIKVSLLSSKIAGVFMEYWAQDVSRCDTHGHDGNDTKRRFFTGSHIVRIGWKNNTYKHLRYDVLLPDLRCRHTPRCLVENPIDKF